METKDLLLNDYRNRIAQIEGGRLFIGINKKTKIQTDGVIEYNHDSISIKNNIRYSSIQKFISFKHRFIYFLCPKVASQTMKVNLFSFCGDVECIHTDKSLNELLLQHPEIGGFYKFSVVRHPFVRLVSGYIDKILHSDSAKNKMVIRDFGSIPESFNDFVKRINDNKSNALNKHWCSQESLLSNLNDKLIVDAVVHLENINTELNDLFNILGLENIELRKVKNTREMHNDLSDFDQNILSNNFFWSEEIESIVMDVYSKDYSSFGYLPFDRYHSRNRTSSPG